MVLPLVLLAAFVTWKAVNPAQIFHVSDDFAYPIAATQVANLPDLRPETCGTCHQPFYEEWKTSIHSRSWSDPLFQAYNRYDGYLQICLNCHTPLQNQQPNLVQGHTDSARLQPILAPNPDFDPDLRQTGVTCAACHVRDGKIHGPFGSKLAPHPTVKSPLFTQEGEVCKRCHWVKEERWDVLFYKEGPCGTYEDLFEQVKAGKRQDVGCYTCHMPAVQRPLVPGGPVRATRRHLWRGGHDPEMVRQALKMTFSRNADASYRFTIVNHGAGHRLPSGAPMRYLQLTFRSYDEQGESLEAKTYTMKRNVIWRPLIIDLKDTRLVQDELRTYTFQPDHAKTHRVAAVLTYHLMPQEERQAIGAPETEVIMHELFRQEIDHRADQSG